MYEHMTREAILRKAFDAVLEWDSTLDTRQGSMIYNALAPAAMELEAAYIQLDTILEETFADTAHGVYLEKRTAERGITPYPATAAVLRGEFNIDVPIGARFSLDRLNYVVTERIAPGAFRLACEAMGSEGNEQLGKLVPIDYVEGLTTARLTEVLIPGEDKEDEEHLRQRYFDSLDGVAFGGNQKDYKEKVGAIPGVGGCKLYPVWNGGGTVKLVIVASNYAVPSDELIEDIQTQIDPEQNHGEGVGLAPIGHVVTVAAVSAAPVNIGLKITFQAGWTWADVRPYTEQVIDEYFVELAESWAQAANLVVRISQLETRILDLPGVLDIANTTLNGKTENVVLGPDEIPARGNVSG